MFFNTFFRQIMVIMALVAALLATPAWAWTQREGHICFRNVDVDQDGRITAQEFKVVYGAEHMEYFSKADSDQDGLLTHDEYHSILGHGSEEG